MDLSFLPDDLIRYIRQFVGDVSAPFAKELLKHNFKQYYHEISNTSETLEVISNGCEFQEHMYRIIEYIDGRQFRYMKKYKYTILTSCRIIWTTNFLDLIISNKRNVLKTLNTKKQLNILSHQHYNLSFSKLNLIKITNLYRWYVMHYE